VTAARDALAPLLAVAIVLPPALCLMRLVHGAWPARGLRYLLLVGSSVGALLGLAIGLAIRAIT
jgi:hypothetical protein